MSNADSRIMHLIFDFDGTLVDSFCCVVDVFNALAGDETRDIDAAIQ